MRKTGRMDDVEGWYLPKMSHSRLGGDRKLNDVCRWYLPGLYHSSWGMVGDTLVL